MKHSIHRFLILSLLISSFAANAQSPTWDVLFAKSEKQYLKGNFTKVDNKLKKLRKKDLAKKYGNDSTLLGLAYLMEAKALEQLRDYTFMETAIQNGVDYLEKHGQRNPYAYTMGYLRLIDLYQQYGNFRKADSLITKLERLGTTTDLVKNELLIRKSLNWIENGYYLEADSLIKALIEIWPSQITARYGTEAPNKLNEAYRKDLLALLYVSQVRILSERGLFGEAANRMKPVRKLISGIASPKTTSYLDYIEVVNYYQWNNLDDAEKLIGKLVKGKPAPTWLEPMSDLDILILLQTKEFDDASSIAEDEIKAMKKRKVNSSYLSLKERINTAYLETGNPEIKTNTLPKFSSLLAGLEKLPVDHLIRSQMITYAINYVNNTGFDANFNAVEPFYLGLNTSLRHRYIRKSIPVAVSSISTAGYYLNFSDSPRKAFPYLKGQPEKLPLRELSVNHPTYQKVVDDLREYFIVTGNFDAPISMKQEVVNSLRKNPNANGVTLGKSISELAQLQTLGGYYKDAEANTEESLKLIRKDGEKKSVEYIKALNNAALLYGTMGLYDKAERLLNEGTSLMKKVEINNKSLKLSSIEDLAFLYTRLGNYTETEELLKEVIESKTATSSKSSHRLIKPYRSLGELYLIKGDYPAADKYLHMAQDLTRKTYGDTTLIYAETLIKLAQLDIELGVYREALDKSNKIHKIRNAKLRPNHILIADIYQLIGQIYFLSGLDSDKAISYFEQSRDIIELNFNNKHPLYAEALKSIAYVYINKGNLDEALILLNKADNIWETSLGNKNKSSGEVARLKGDIYNYKGEFKDARKEYDKSARFFKKIFNSLHPDYLTTQSRLARANYIEGNLKEVESILSTTTAAYISYTETYFPTLSEEEKAKFWAKIKPDFEFYNSVAVSLMDTKPKYLEDMFDFALMTKGLLLNSSIKTRNSILNSGDSTLIKKFEQWLANKEYLTNILSQSDEELAANEINPDKIKEETVLLEKELSEKSEAFTESFEYKIYSWKDVQSALKPNEAAIEMVRYREFDTQFNEEKIRYAALILTAETKKNPILVLLADGTQMENKSFSLQRNGVKFKVKEEKSYKAYWEPIYEQVKDKSIIYFSPDGVYNQINVESLYMGNDEYVIDKSNVRVVGSTKTLAINRSKQAKKAKKDEPLVPVTLSALIIGNPVYYENSQNQVIAQEATRSGNNLYIPQLPGTELETKTISDLLKANNWNIDFYLGDEANEKTIKDSQNKTLIHIATHGFFDEKKHEHTGFNLLDEENPLDRSGLMARGAGDVLLKSDKNYNIEDGILTATEAMNLNFDKTELVVLSACETGRGEVKQGEGVFGLQRSFLVAGADAIVMSLFQVSDEVTQNLMVEFYKNWLAGDDKRVAFNKAQKTIKETYPQPIYWGAFTMIAKN